MNAQKPLEKKYSRLLARKEDEKVAGKLRRTSNILKSTRLGQLTLLVGEIPDDQKIPEKILHARRFDKANMLHVAAMSEHVSDVARVAKDRGWNLSPLFAQKTSGGLTPLHVAAREKSSAGLEALADIAEAGAPPTPEALDMPDNEGETFLDEATRYGHLPAAVRLFAAAGHHPPEKQPEARLTTFALGYRQIDSVRVLYPDADLSYRQLRDQVRQVGGANGVNALFGEKGENFLALEKAGAFSTRADLKAWHEDMPDYIRAKFKADKDLGKAHAALAARLKRRQARPLNSPLKERRGRG